MIDPQELNLYAYVRNNALKYVDPEAYVTTGNNVTTKYFYDNLSRLTRTTEGAASISERNTAYDYQDASLRIVSTSDLDAPTGGRKTVSAVTYDQLGRPHLTRQLETAAQSGLVAILVT